MKIILCKGQFLGPISGADETLVTYATQLHKAGYSVSVLLLYEHSQQDQYYLRLREAGVPVYTVGSSSARSSLVAGRKIARGIVRTLPSSSYLVRKHAQKVATNIASRQYSQCHRFLSQSRADLLHVITPDPAAMVMIRAAHAVGIPVIYQEMGIPFHPPEFESYYGQFTSVLPLCTEVAALSPLLAQQCRTRLTHPNEFSVLPIITDDLRNGHAPPRASPTSVVVGFAARIEHLKGPMILLEAFARASQSWGDLRLWIAGSGSLEQKLMARARALGVDSRCDFVGVYNRPGERKAFMEQLDIFALPSLTEGTPNTIVEAMSHGVPPIGSAVGGIPDLITKEVGILCPPGDVTAFAQAIIRLAGDRALRLKMGQAARNRYEQLFSPKAVLPILIDTYSRVLSKGARSSHRLQHEDHPWARSSADSSGTSMILESEPAA